MKLAFCASIERPPDGEPWVQVKTGVLNVFYPSDEPPLEKLASLVTLPNATSCPAWEPWKYATLEFAPLDARATADLIEQLFVRFYGFPAETHVASEIFEMG
jgi:hypothetical protein